MTELDKILVKLCEREESSGCYNIKINGVGIYNLVRFRVRNDYLQTKGYNFVEKYSGAKPFDIIKSFIISAYQLAKIRLFKKKYDAFIYPFLRLDHVNGVYLDKYTDSIIDCCGLDNYIIFERGRRGMHFTPRVHQNEVVYTNLLDFYFDLISRFGRKRFKRKYSGEFEELYATIEKVLERKDFNRTRIVSRVLYGLCKIKVYESIFKRLEIKKVIAPSRANILSHICAGKKLGIKTYELQHGITYGQTALYSGYRDPDFTPDGFLAFGNTPPRNVYGIDESKIINIGWAFQDYLDKTVADSNVAEKDVLVISGPCLTDKILDATIRLATLFPSIQFVVRPHPAEVVTDAHRELASKYANISWQDPKVNVAVAMKQYNHLIGENSTVLYEALTYGKKVARICFEGFAPRYLTPEDEECFWKISDRASFDAFINGKAEDKKSMKVYSKFDKELFMILYNA